MKRIALFTLSLAVCLSTTLPAAVTYNFIQTTRSEIKSLPSGELRGHATLDADHARIDFAGKTAYGENAYILSFADQKKMMLVDPGQKTVAEINLANVSNALASSKITVSNLKKDFKKLPEHITVAGVPTDHYRLDASYDMTVMFGDMPLTQNVHTTVDKWTTSSFGEVTDLLSSGVFKSGNAEIDGLIENETTAMKGLTVREVVTVVTGPASSWKASSRQIPITTRKQSSEIIVSDVQVIAPDNKLFQIPADYSRLNPKTDETVHNLSLVP